MHKVHKEPLSDLCVPYLVASVAKKNLNSILTR